MTERRSASTVRRSLGRQLRQLRESAGKSLADSQAAHLGSVRNLQRIEAGQARPKHTFVRSACQVYGADQATTDRLLAMTDQADTDTWWEAYGTVQHWFTLLLDLEGVADRIYLYSGSLVPGLLQTPAYAKAWFQMNPGYVTDKAYAEREVAVRARRQDVVFDRDVAVTAIIDESALQRVVGSKEVMAEQVAHLRELASRTGTQVYVLPLEAGAHAGGKGEFIVLEFDSDEEPDVAYVETYLSGQYSSKPKVMEELRWRYASLKAMSVPLEEYLGP
ncbi:helix-turn-helix transcriptional regulator [Kineosporia sp. NBRC 101731]|uniref:helix-turn-helix domain-containing protein n=1 Tax=Kineosporia sp. NBRC 101731 TaxID=3032199 RepID=UPI002552DF2C|nr:helix-turn-helix transcriptional regulator [Kineosporia sp. NBRC 101731]